MTENELLPRLLIEGSKIGLRVFRNQVGKYELKDGRWLTSGLCEGSSDLIGYVPVTITPAMVGRTVAVFVAVEAKGTKSRTEKTRAAQQNLFLDVVRKAGAFGAQVRSVDELRDAFAEWLAERTEPRNPDDFCTCGHRREGHHIWGKCHNCKCTGFVLDDIEPFCE